MKERLLILGAGGFGRAAAETAQADGWGQVAFLDDAATAPDVLGRCEEYARFLADYPSAAVAIGNNAVRLQWLARLRQAGFALPTIVHPRAFVSPSARLSEGCFVMPMAVVHTGVTVGEGCLVNCGAILDHNCTLRAGVHAGPGSIIKAGAEIPAQTKVEAGCVVRSPWEKQDADKK